MLGTLVPSDKALTWQGNPLLSYYNSLLQSKMFYKKIGVTESNTHNKPFISYWIASQLQVYTNI